MWFLKKLILDTDEDPLEMYWGRRVVCSATPEIIYIRRCLVKT